MARPRATGNRAVGIPKTVPAPKPTASNVKASKAKTSKSKADKAKVSKVSRPQKGALETRLEGFARQSGATFSAEGDAFMLSRRGERTSLRVTEKTENHEIERYLRGASA